MTPLLAAVCAAVAGAGVALAIAGWRGVLPAVSGAGGRAKGHHPSDLVPRVVFGAIGFVLGLLLTGWPVAGCYLAFGGAAVPALMRSKRERRAAVDKVEAIATWTESLKDIMGVGAGLHNTLQLSARAAPAPIGDEVRNLAVRLQHESVEVALVRFAADLANPRSDIVVASLLLASRRQAGGLPEVLSSVARATRDSAAMTQRIQGSRERAYTQSRIVAATSAVFILFLVIFRRDFLGAFDTIGGQIVLAVIGAMFACSGYAMYKIGRPPKPVRVFGRLERIVRPAASGMNHR